MLDQKDIDAVIVSTTEHTHALASVMAMKRGKHVYCEKPLAHSVYEARVMRETCKQMKVATQMGTQIHATDNYRRVVELIQSGAIGPVREAHVWVDQGIEGPRSRPQETPPVPKNLHWDLWLGPAPWRPYHPCYFKDRSMSWQNWWDFGNGALGDMGSHTIDLPFWALELQYPTTVEAEGPLPVRTGDVSRSADRALGAPGPRQPAAGEAHLVRRQAAAQVARGRRPDEMASGDHVRRRQGDPAGRLRQADPAAARPISRTSSRRSPRFAPSLGHHQEWIHACKTGAPTLCNFDYSGTLVEHNLLGTVAFRAGKKLEWDPENLKARNCPEADRFIRQPYREGWTL